MQDLASKMLAKLAYLLQDGFYCVYIVTSGTALTRYSENQSPIIERTIYFSTNMACAACTVVSMHPKSLFFFHNLNLPVTT